MSTTINSFSVLAVLHNSKKNYIDSFIPFVCNLVSEKKYLTVRIDEFCEDFCKRYGLKIPNYPMLGILEQAVKKGFFRRKNKTEFIPIMDSFLQIDDFNTIAKEQERTFNKVIKEFIKYCKENHEIDFDREKGNLIFLNFLKKHDLNILFAKKNLDSFPVIEENSGSKSDNYLISKFILSCHDSEPMIFDFIVHVSFFFNSP